MRNQNLAHPKAAILFQAAHSPHRKNKDFGFSLVEVLVSIVVLSFGLLGMVGMQAAALKSNREARLQSSAVVLARELADMMRGNKVESVLTAASGNPYLGSFNSVPLVATTPTYCLNVASGTTACGLPPIHDIGNAQMTEWLARVDAELPGARVNICFDTAPFDTNGLPQWNCTAGTDGVIVIKIGWTISSTNRSKTGADALERATRPSVVLPVIAGSST